MNIYIYIYSPVKYHIKKNLDCFHTPVCLAFLTPRIDDFSLLLGDAVVSDTAAPVPPAALVSAGGAQPPPHASLLPVGL